MHFEVNEGTESFKTQFAVNLMQMLITKGVLKADEVKQLIKYTATTATEENPGSAEAITKLSWYYAQCAGMAGSPNAKSEWQQSTT